MSPREWKWLATISLMINIAILPAFLSLPPWWVRGIVAVVLLHAFVVLRLWIAERRRRDVKRGRVCDRCGYSLRGNRTAKCPECGRDFLERVTLYPLR